MKYKVIYEGTSKDFEKVLNAHADGWIIVHIEIFGSMSDMTWIVVLEKLEVTNDASE